MMERYQLPTFIFSKKKYGSYIYYRAWNHKEDCIFFDKIRSLKRYSEFKNFEQLKNYFNNSKKEVERHVVEDILPRIADDIKKGKFDIHRDSKEWTALYPIDKSIEFIPVVDLIDEFLQEVYQKKCTNSTKANYKNALNGFNESLKRIYGVSSANKFKIRDITENHIIQVFNNWKLNKWSQNTHRTYRSKVRLFFEKYISIIHYNPVSKTTSIRTEAKRKNYSIPESDFNKILLFIKSSDKNKYKELLAFVKLMYYGLMRGDTMYKLKCRDIKEFNSENSIILIYPEMVKNKVAGEILIPNHVIKYMENIGLYKRDCPDKYLFPSNRGSNKTELKEVGYKKRNRMWASNLWTEMLTKEINFDKSFIQRHNVYSIKGTGALNLLNNEGWSIRKISKQMLHSSVQTTFNYIEKLQAFNASDEFGQFKNSKV